MNSLYNLALRQYSTAQSDLSLLETAIPQSASYVSLAGQLTASLSAFGRTIDDYESMAKRELSVQKREKALERVKKFREEERDIRKSLAQIKGSAADSRTPHNDRNMAGSSSLQGSTFGNGTFASTSSTGLPQAYSNLATFATTNDPQSALQARFPTHQQQQHGALPPQQRPNPLSAYRMNASAEAMFGADTLSAREGHALREHSFIRQTDSQLDTYIAQGREIWSNLTEQRDILKGTQRKLRDVGVTLGLSRNVIGYIERRSTQDNVLFVVGVVFTLTCFYYIYKWFG
jgi:Golgi SNAP receptor complex protein 2